MTASGPKPLTQARSENSKPESKVSAPKKAPLNAGNHPLFSFFSSVSALAIYSQVSKRHHRAAQPMLDSHAPPPVIACLATLSKFPADAFWMLAVDGVFFKEEQGPTKFEERENGSVEGILNALALGISRIDREITFEDMLEFHKVCLTPIKNKGRLMHPGLIRQASAEVGIGIGCATKAGVETIFSSDNPICGIEDVGEKQAANLKQELLVRAEQLRTTLMRGGKSFEDAMKVVNQDMIEYAHRNLITHCGLPAPYAPGPIVEGRKTGLFKSEEKKQRDSQISKFSKPQEIKELIGRLHRALDLNLPLVYHPPSKYIGTNTELLAAHLTKLSKQTFERYTQKQLAAKSIDEKEKAIVQATKERVLIHPTQDGTNRVNVNIILNLLCIQQGLLPCVFSQPNIFECHTVDEILAEMKKARVVCKTIINNPNAEIFGFSNKQLDPRLKAKFSKASQHLLRVIQQTHERLSAAPLQSQSAGKHSRLK